MEENNSNVENIKVDILKKSQTILFSLKDLFTACGTGDVHFIIPMYQRNYVWSQSTYKVGSDGRLEGKNLSKKRLKMQLEWFFDDVVRTCQNKDFHYTGIIGLQMVKTDEKDLVFNIIDGQQRLTSAILLLSALMKYYSNGEIKDYIWDKKNALRLSYEKDTDQEDILSDIINDDEPADISDPYYIKLKQTKDFFEKKLQEIKQEELNNIFTALTERFMFSVLFAPKDDENKKVNIGPELIFDSINSRGKVLTKLEILKNRYFYIWEFCQKNKNDLRNKWKKIYKNIYKATGTDFVIDEKGDDEFLLCVYYIFGTGSEVKENVQIIFDRIFDKFYPNNNEYDIIWINDFLSKLVECSLLWKEIKNPQNTSKFYEVLSKLCRITSDNFSRAFTMLILYLVKKDFLNYENALNILKFYEKYLFANYFIAEHTAVAHMVTKVRKIVKEELNKENCVFQLINIINEMINDEENSLKSYLSEKALNEWCDKRENKGFYDWKGISYTLYEMNLESQAEDENLVDWKEIKTEKSKTIEHIFPQTPDGRNDSKSKEYWKYAYPNTWGNKEILHMTNMLGNLVPLSRAGNSKVSNKMYPIKYENYKNGSFMCRNVCDEYGKDIWSVEQIENRSCNLINKIQEKWFTIDELIIGNTQIKGKEYKLDNKQKNKCCVIMNGDERENFNKSEEFRKEKMKQCAECIEDKESVKKNNRTPPITLDKYLDGKNIKMLNLFNKLYNQISKKVPNIVLYVLPQYIGFKAGEKGNYFADISIQKNRIRVCSKIPNNKYNIGEEIPEHFLWALRYRIYIDSEQKIDELVKILQESYDIVNKKENKNEY